jgi:hypothetical protein
MRHARPIPAARPAPHRALAALLFAAALLPSLGCGRTETSTTTAASQPDTRDRPPDTRERPPSNDSKPNAQPSPASHPPSVLPPPATPIDPEGRATMSNSILGLTPDEYWSNPWKNLDSLAADKLMSGERGIYIDAPATLIPGARRTAPLLTVYCDSRETMVFSPFKLNSSVVVMRLIDNDLRVRKAFTQDEPPTPPTNPPSPGMAAREYTIDLLATNTLREDDPGEHIAMVILRDMPSNRVYIRMERAGSTFNDPEVEKFIAERRAKLPASDISPPEGDAATFGDGTGCPPIPEKPGIALNIDRVIVRDEGRAIVRGSFRLPLLPADVISSPAKLPKGLTKKIGRPAPTGVAKIWLVAFPAAGGGPRKIAIHAPTFTKVEGLPDEPSATGFFHINLLADDDLSLDPDTYFLYAFSNIHMTGPHPMAIVAEAALPKAP